jgi:O-methyltransferase domain
MMKRSLTDTFTQFYDGRNATWGNLGSGPGSSKDYNVLYISFMINFLKANRITSVADLGCGDWQFSDEIYKHFPSLVYTGVDCVKTVIDKNKVLFPNHVFLHEELDPSTIPDAELYILKDVLQHWSNVRIKTFLSNMIQKRKFRYMIIVNCCSDHAPDDIEDGSWRPLSCRHTPLLEFNMVSIMRYQTKEVLLFTKEYFAPGGGGCLFF